MWGCTVDKPYVVYGAKGSGSVPVEAALTLIGLPYEVVQWSPWENAEEREREARVNPMRQVPTLVLPTGEVMTESAAILMWLAEQHPEARLAPPVGDPRRRAFLRWMTFIPASIYSLYWIRDDPTRLAADQPAVEVIQERTRERIAECWRIMDSQIEPGRYLLGEDLGVLDLYVTVVSRWTPRRERFYREAPKMAEVVRRVDAEPRLQDFWAERLPPED